MSSTTELIALGKMVAASHGWPAAKAFQAYHPTDADKVAIAGMGRDFLDIFPNVVGACAPMSAAFAAGLERVISTPIQVVAGSLFADAVRVFGSDAPLDGETLFSRGDLDWDGHVWVMMGGYIADISIFRTAYSRFAPPTLRKHIDATFGPGRGMYFDAWRHTRHVGLRYKPGYVLSRDQEDGLLGQAREMIQSYARERSSASARDPSAR